MSKITNEAAHAFMRRERYKNGNTQVIVDGDVVRMYLFGNCIAQKTPLATTITTDGWMTKTTKDRLNGIAGVHIHQEKGKWYLNSNLWNGSNVIVGAFGIWSGL